MSPDPVLRLDNSEPLDFGYYNPGLQMDNIQMTNFPHGRLNWEEICDAKKTLYLILNLCEDRRM